MSLDRHQSMSLKKSIALLVLLVACSLTMSLAFRDNLGLPVRVFNDPADMGVYTTEGSWFTQGKIPYKEAFSEYPQIAMWFFAVPHIVASWINPQGKNPFDYATIYSLFMVVFSFLSISVLYRLLDRPNLAFLLLLPASFYFTRNRYDIMPCLVGLVSLLLFSKQRYTLSAIVLAAGVLTKWYLLMMLPIYLAYYFYTRRRIPWPMIAAFCATSFIIILPTLISAGINGLLLPYKYHWTTDMNEDSAIYWLNYFLSKVFNLNIGNPSVFALFFILQFSAIPFCITSPVDSFEKVVRYSALCILVFMLFAKFNSPQWVLWVSPLLVINARKPSDIAWIVLFDLWTYVWFPVGFDLLELQSIPYLLVILVKTLILIAFIVRLSRGILKDNLLVAFAQRRLALAHIAQT
jgi:hypothetical protein